MISSDQRRSVVHVIGALVAGGAERFVASLLMELRRREIDTELWVLSRKTDAVGASLQRMMKTSGVPVYFGPTERVGVRTVAWYRDRLCASPPILHLHTPNTELAHFLATLIPLGCVTPALYRTIHSTELPAGTWNAFAYRGNRVKSSIACGVASERKYRRFVAGDLVSIPNGIDINFPPVSEEGRLAARERLKIDKSHYHFISIGRMSGRTLSSAQKAHDVILGAWKESGLGDLNASLHLLGDGNLRPELERDFGAGKGVHFHGIRDDIATWLQAGDCFVMPSRFEGLPIAGIEAICAGLPCLFSDIEPLRELGAPRVLWSGVNDVKVLADAMRKMYTLRPRIKPLEIAEFRARFSMERVADAYLNVYGITS